MKQKSRHIFFSPYGLRLCAGSLLWLLLGLVSCDIDGDLAECPYNTRLEYWYTGTGQANVLPDYVYRMDEFVFDSLGVLCHRREVTSKKGVAAELDLPPGRYTLVAWGNTDSVSRVSEAKIGETRLEDIMLYADHPFGGTGTRAAAAGTVQASTEPLYYGYAVFRIAGRGVSRGRVDMVHAHLKLDVTVKWKGRAPTDTGDMYMTLSGVYPEYCFEPGFELKGSPYSAYAADEGSGGPTRSGVWYYIPGRPEGCEPVTYKVAANMDITRTVSVRFVTYRLASDDHPVLQLFGGGGPLIRAIDLEKYFRTMQVDLDRNLRQEFSLVVEVDASGGIIVSSAKVSDWVDGGTIGFGN